MIKKIIIIGIIICAIVFYIGLLNKAEETRNQITVYKTKIQYVKIIANETAILDSYISQITELNTTNDKTLTDIAALNTQITTVRANITYYKSKISALNEAE